MDLRLSFKSTIPLVSISRVTKSISATQLLPHHAMGKLMLRESHGVQRSDWLQV